MQTYREDNGRIMPGIFVAGPAKSGSTFLWECIHHTFHPEHVCESSRVGGWSDGACHSKRFVLPPLSADTAKPACHRFEKEGAFWRYWGRRPYVTWQRYGGPRLPLDDWELRQSCGGRRRASVASSAASRDAPPMFAGHRALEDTCLQDMACGSGRVAYNTAMPVECKAQCTPCAHHPGWVNNFDAACAVSAPRQPYVPLRPPAAQLSMACSHTHSNGNLSPFCRSHAPVDSKCAQIPPYKCASSVCADAPYVPKALRRANYSGYHARAFVLNAFPSYATHHPSPHRPWPRGSPPPIASLPLATWQPTTHRLTARGHVAAHHPSPTNPTAHHLTSHHLTAHRLTSHCLRPEATYRPSLSIDASTTCPLPSLPVRAARAPSWPPTSPPTAYPLSKATQASSRPLRGMHALSNPSRRHPASTHSS